MTAKLCKKCNHLVGRHTIIRDKLEKEKGIMCLDCDCNTMKRSELDTDEYMEKVGKQGFFD